MTQKCVLPPSRVLVFLQVGVATLKRKSKAEALLQYNFPFPFYHTKSMRSIVWNPQPVAVWNLALASMESMRSIVWNQERRKTEKYKLSLDAMRGRAAIPYNSLCELMPYQALRSWINKKTNFGSSFYFGGPSRTRT